MSTRCSGLASRSFIIGSRLWPPAMTRASGPRRSSVAIAPSTLVARSYSNGAGVCNVLLSRSGRLGRQPPAWRSDVLAALVLLRRAGADHRRDRQLLRRLVTDARVQQAGREAAAGHVAQDCAARAHGRDRRLAPEPRERERALRVHLADPRRLDVRAPGEGAQA